MTEIKFKFGEMCQAYDGCSTTAGKENGLKAIIQRQYPNINFIHCASHRLNLVINDLNTLPEIRNAIVTIKEIIKFFRESKIRRQLIPSIPILCQTRWCEQHKSIRKFKEGFIKILGELDKISNGTSDAKTKSYMLYCAASKSSFLICLFIISKYSTLLEPITLKLQDKNINLIDAQNYIKQLLVILDHERAISLHIFTKNVRICARNLIFN